MLLLFELTHDYNIIVPTLGAVGLAYWIASLPTTAAALQQLLPEDTDAQLKPPSSTPMQISDDPESVTEQLNMGIAKDNTAQSNGAQKMPRTLISSKVCQWHSELAHPLHLCMISGCVCY